MSDITVVDRWLDMADEGRLRQYRRRLVKSCAVFKIAEMERCREFCGSPGDAGAFGFVGL